MANGNGDDDDEQRAEASIDAEESRRDSYYDCGLRISPRLLCLIPTMTYTWYELRVRDWIVGCRTIRKWRLEDGVTLDVPSFSSLLFSLLLYFFGSRPSTNGVGTGFYHLRRRVKWRWSFPVRRIRRKVALSGADRLWDLWVRTFAYVGQLFACFLYFPTLVRVYAAQGVCT